MEIGIPGLFHFLYKSKHILQAFEPKNSPPYIYKQDWKRLLNNYHMLSIKMSKSGLNWIYQQNAEESIVAAQTSQFEIYIAVGPFLSLQEAHYIYNQLIIWLKAEEDSLFIISSPLV